MNFKQFGSLLPDNPLCGISTYKDNLNLATGDCTRNIKKYELTGNEPFYSTGQNGKTTILVYFSPSGIKNIGNIVSYNCFCSHYKIGSYYPPSENEGVQYTTVNLYFRIKQSSTTDFTTFLQQQYAAGTPVTIWYVLATPTTETITVPSGLSGTEEGYLIQDGTPTPTNPIYPTANTVEKWFDINHYIMGTDTDTITTLPAVIYANDITATVGLKGDMEQSGTPTPTDPIQPQECGDKTANLCPPLTEWVDGYVASNGNIAAPSETYKEKSSDYILIGAEKAYTFSMENGFPGGENYSWRAIGWYAQDKTFISRASGNSTVALSTNAPSNAVYCRLSYRTHGETTNSILNEGSTPLSFEPYGVKIPILSNSTTTPVYLGEVQSTRKVKKLVLTGEESLVNAYENAPYRLPINDIAISSSTSSIEWYCSHYQSVSTDDSWASYDYCISRTSTTAQSLQFRDVTKGDITAFKQYLAQQYDAGTPVTVWYVLATPTTGIVNEPLRKIGDYADEVSGITIPTIAGANTLSVGTTLQPSEVTVNYKGWHPVADVHERESGAWT